MTGAGQSLSDILAKSFSAKGLCNLRMVTLEDGAMRGQRLLQMRTADGLEVEIAVDRGFDISAVRFKGVNIGWVGPCDFPSRIDPDSENGLGLLRAFEGFLVTCGLDHHGLPASGPASHFNYPHRTSVSYPLHGRISGQSAIVERRAIELDAPEPRIVCTGFVRQAALFGEVLELRRTVTLPAFGSSIRIEDTVRNAGGTPARHGLLYHVNLGYPLLDASTTLGGVAEADATAFADFPPIPQLGAVETFALIEPSDPFVAAIEISNAAAGVSMSLRYDRTTLPNLGMWRVEQSGLFALGIEPQTVLGPAAVAYSPDNPDFLQPGEQKNYWLEIGLSSL